MTTNEQQAGPAVALGPVSLDVQRLTLPELAQLLQALQVEIRRRHAERTRGTAGGTTGPGDDPPDRPPAPAAAAAALGSPAAPR